MMIDNAIQEKKSERHLMVETQIAGRGIKDTYVLEAMRAVPREMFMPVGVDELAYEDMPLPIEEGQTISQPYIVALMAELAQLHPDDRVLEVGAGSGYAAAVISLIAEHVYTIEHHESLAMRAENILSDLGYDNVSVIHGDGSLGLPVEAPFDVIMVTAGAPEVPKSLKAQLSIGGRLIIPVGGHERQQNMMRLIKLPDGDFKIENHGPVAFVPLIGRQGWFKNNLITRKDTKKNLL
jgi:protein-L-isoaspartate(D-aspartate) O-methyltransferase